MFAFANNQRFCADSSAKHRGFTPTPMPIGVSVRSKRGFTLIELLVVISIIGLLSSIVFASLTGARARARIANVQGSFRTVLTSLVLCRDDGGTIAGYDTTSKKPTAASALCTGSALVPAANVWPTLPAGWAYGAMTNETNDNFTFNAAGDSKTITCAAGGGCVTS
jgi:prepilin-type N-terminal cleavage/methylation domain-containing protein